MALILKSASAQSASALNAAVSNYPYTVACRFSLQSASVNQQLIMFGPVGGATDVLGLGVDAATGKANFFTADSGGTFDVNIFGPVLKINNWYSLMCAGVSSTNRTGYLIDHSTNQIYTTATTNLQNIGGSANRTWLGAYASTTGTDDYSIFDVAVWSSALPYQSVIAYFAGVSPPQVQQSTLEAFWKFDGNANPQPDLSTKGRPLTLNASPAAVNVSQLFIQGPRNQFPVPTRSVMWSQGGTAAPSYTPYNPWPQAAPILAQ